jgi:hypothetical protein
MSVNSVLHRDTRRLQWLRFVSTLAAGLALQLAVGTAAAAAEDVPHPLVEAVHAALDAWSQFASAGDLSALGFSFAAGGPQWLQFEEESMPRRALPGKEPLRFEVLDLRLRRMDVAIATVWAEVEASRPGFVSEVFKWDFDLIRENGRWRVWTVVPAEAPSEPAQVPPVTTSTVATTTTTHVAAAGSRESPPVAAAAGRSRGTRLPVVSAWIVVVTVVGVAVAGYMAPRIDRRGEG